MDLLAIILLIVGIVKSTRKNQKKPASAKPKQPAYTKPSPAKQTTYQKPTPVKQPSYVKPAPPKQPTYTKPTPTVDLTYTKPTPAKPKPATYTKPATTKPKQSIYEKTPSKVQPLPITEYKSPAEDAHLMDKVYDLMITGYNGNLEFDRDFLAEGMDMLNRIQMNT